MNSENKQKILTENKKLFLKTQQTTCVSNESSDVGLSYTFADNDFTNKYVSSYSHINNGFKMENVKCLEIINYLIIGKNINSLLLKNVPLKKV